MRYLFLLALVGVANAAEDVTGKIERRYGGGYWLAVGFKVPQSQLAISAKAESEKAEEEKKVEDKKPSAPSPLQDISLDKPSVIPKPIRRVNYPVPPVVVLTNRKSQNTDKK